MPLAKIYSICELYLYQRTLNRPDCVTMMPFVNGIFFLLVILAPGESVDKREMQALLAMYRKVLHILSEENNIPRAEELHNSFAYEEDNLNLLVKNCVKAQIESFKSNYFNSNFYFYEALKYAEKVRSNYFLFEIYHNLAINFRQQNKVDKAIENYKKAAVYIQKVNRPQDLALLYNNLGLAFFYNHDLDSAETYFNKSYRLYSDLGVKTGIAYFHGNMAEISLARDLPDQALQELNKCNEVLYAYNNAGINAQIDLNYAKVYIHKEDWEMAHTYLLKSLRHALKIENKKLQHEIQSLLTSANLALNDTEAAFQSQSELLKLERLLNEQDLELKLQSAKYGYEFEQQVAANQLQELKLQIEKRKNIFLFIGVSLLLLFISGLFYLYRKIIHKNTLITRQKEEIQDINTRLEVLNSDLETKVQERTYALNSANIQLSQLNDELADSILKGKTIERTRLASELHDNLGGIFTALRWNFMALDFERIEGRNKEILLKVKGGIENGYSEVRNISHDLLPNVILENSLIDACKKLEETLNLNEKIDFQIQIDPVFRFPKNSEYEIYLVIMELCTNAIKHSDGNRIKIHLEKKGRRPVLYYEDNGSSFPATTSTKGMGLQNISKRLKTVGVAFSIQA